MRRWLGLMWVLAYSLAMADDDIVDVLRRSQQIRLDAMAAAAPDSDRAALVRRSFEQLLAARPVDPACELHVIRGGVIAETLHGHIVVANESLADLPETVRLFVLAHELGHVQLAHWRAMAEVYVKWIPGAVTPAQTDPVAVPLGREASRLAHQQEFAADRYAAQTLQALGHAPDELLAVFRYLGATTATATHPSTGQRVALLRELALTPSR